VAQPLWFTDDPAACQLLADDPFALLVGFAIDQQVPVQKAFAGPYVLKQRVGTLEPKRLASIDLEPAFREKPAIHRFPGSMASRVRELAAVVAEEYGGDASRIWGEAKDTADLKRRIGALPGFGPMKVTGLAAVLAQRLGVKIAAPLAPDHACLGDVDSPQALLDYQSAKRAHKASLKQADARAKPARPSTRRRQATP
jgi:uncharacterized HhH-GPD family protein